MVHDVVVLGASIAGLTAARRLASEGFDVLVLDPNPAGGSAAIGHGVAAQGHASTIANMAGAYGSVAAKEHVTRNLVGIEEIARVIATGDVSHQRLPLHDQSLGVALDRELSQLLELMIEAGAKVDLLDLEDRIGPGAGLRSEAIVLDPAEYAAALAKQVVASGAEVVHDATVTHLQRRDGATVIRYRDNLAWNRVQVSVRSVAVIDTLAISPWGRVAGVGVSQSVPVIRVATDEVPQQVWLSAGPPVWMVRPIEGGIMALGPKRPPESAEVGLAELVNWVKARYGDVEFTTAHLTIDPSDHGRPLVGASAIPGGFYTRGNGRGELMNGTASGSYLAALLLGGAGVGLPTTSKLRARWRTAVEKLVR